MSEKNERDVQTPQAPQVSVDSLSGRAILDKAVSVGANKAAMSAKQSFPLALLAGMFVSLGGTFMILVKSDSTLGFTAATMLGALAFCLGLFLVLVAGAELFTGNALMVIGHFSKEYGWGRVLHAWAVVYAGNLLASLVMVALIAIANVASLNGGAVGDTMVSIASSKAALSVGEMFVRGILCNVLVCLAVWMGFAGRTVADKLCATLLPVMAFASMGFEHSVANMFILPMGLVAKSLGYGADVALAAALNPANCLLNIVVVSLGNVVGAAVLVGGLYWAAYGRE